MKSKNGTNTRKAILALLRRALQIGVPTSKSVPFFFLLANVICVFLSFANAKWHVRLLASSLHERQMPAVGKASQIQIPPFVHSFITRRLLSKQN